VFEFSESEEKANRENESQLYVHHDNKSKAIFIVKTGPYFNNAIIIPHQFILVGALSPFTNYTFLHKYFYPPGSLFLLFRSLLI
jgi:hypothetical protein